MIDKNTLRIEARRLRALLDYDPREFENAAKLFFRYIGPTPGKVIAGYYPKGREFSPLPILEQALAQGFTCALPRINTENKVLDFVRWDFKTPMEEGPYKIQQPKSADIVAPDIFLVPVLAFDRKGHRLGQGGGYYDATLHYWRARKTITAVGLAYAQQACLFNLPAEKQDALLDWVITPQEAIKFQQ